MLTLIPYTAQMQPGNNSDVMPQAQPQQAASWTLQPCCHRPGWCRWQEARSTLLRPPHSPLPQVLAVCSAGHQHCRRGFAAVLLAWQGLTWLHREGEQLTHQLITCQHCAGACDP